MPSTLYGVLISVILVGCIGLIMLVEHFTPNPVIAERPVETIEFQADNDAVYIQTTEDAIAADRDDVLFVKSDEYRVVERKDKSSIRFIGKSPYTVYVPEPQVKEISQEYAKTFGKTLEFKTEE